jgi:ABC-type glycerol-3-phosphate transport system permease component
MKKLQIRMPKKRYAVARSLYADWLNIALIIVMGAFMALPLVYAVSGAFKPLDELFLYPPTFFVRKPTMENFRNLSVLMSNSWVPFSRYIFNTVFLTLVGTAGHVLLASVAAFVLAKHRFPGQKLIFGLVIASLMFASQVTAIPNYIVMSYLGWIDDYRSLIIPAWGFPLGLFLMKQFIEQMVPDSLLEAARIDGAGELRTIFQVVMPIVKPAWLTLIIFSVQALWNNSGSVFIYSEELKPLSYALSQIIQGGIARTGAAAAVTVVMMAVPILTFVVTQSNILETMGTSGIKE